MEPACKAERERLAVKKMFFILIGGGALHLPKLTEMYI